MEEEQLDKTVPIQADWDILLSFMVRNNSVLRLNSDGSGAIYEPHRYVSGRHGFTALKYLINDIKEGRM